MTKKTSPNSQLPSPLPPRVSFFLTDISRTRAWTRANWGGRRQSEWRACDAIPAPIDQRHPLQKTAAKSVGDFDRIYQKTIIHSLAYRVESLVLQLAEDAVYFQADLECKRCFSLQNPSKYTGEIVMKYEHSVTKGFRACRLASRSIMQKR